MRRIRTIGYALPMRAWVLAAAVSGAMLLVSVGVSVLAPRRLRPCEPAPPNGTMAAVSLANDREMARLEQSSRTHPGTDFGAQIAEGARSVGNSRVGAPFPVSEVRAVQLRADGRYVITLANGQVWVAGEAYDRAAIHVGDVATIKPGALRAFFMDSSEITLPALRDKDRQGGRRMIQHFPVVRALALSSLVAGAAAAAGMLPGIDVYYGSKRSCTGALCRYGAATRRVIHSYSVRTACTRARSRLCRLPLGCVGWV